MTDGIQWMVVSSEVLPEAVAKVLEVKRLLASKAESSSAAACKRVGISRSAYYKYRDKVFPYDERLSQNILRIYVLLRDEKGVLSAVLRTLSEQGANVLTVNQSTPMDGVASVTFTLKVPEQENLAASLPRILKELDGVVEARVLSGE